MNCFESVCSVTNFKEYLLESVKFVYNSDTQSFFQYFRYRIFWYFFSYIAPTSNNIL